MNRRERILAAAVGILIVVVVLNYGAKRLADMFSNRHEMIAVLETELEKKKVMKHRGVVADRELKVYDQRSLPADPVLASSRYRAWLLNWVEEAGISAAMVKAIAARDQGDTFTEITFQVACNADLRQLIRLLFSFYSSDSLHRIKHMSARPLEDKRLSLAFTIEAVSMKSAQKDKKLIETPAHRLAFDDVSDYLDVIVSRNPYSPANQPPEFASSSTQRAYLNRPLSFQPRVSDPENDTVSYHLESHDIPGLTLDERTGRIEWTPDKKGEFEILVSAVDDGLPSKKTSQTIKIEVTDPPPDEPTTPAFDKAQFTFVTAIVEVNGRPQVWLDNRTDGKLMKLFVGDTFQIGTFEGKISRIEIQTRSVEIISGKSRVNVRYGQNLSQGTQLANDQDDDVAASSQ